MDKKIIKTQLIHIWNDHKPFMIAVAILIVIAWIN